MKSSSYKDLNVWKKSRELVKEIYRIVKFLPKEETYALSDQIRRSVISVPSNIAEGHGRGRISNKEFVKYLTYSLGSLYEVETQCIAGFDIGYFQKEHLTYVFELTKEISKMLISLMGSLENPINPVSK